MPRRAPFTQADLSRAIGAAEARGKVAVWTPAGIAFLPPDAVPVSAMLATPATPGEEGGNTCDAAFG